MGRKIFHRWSGPILSGLCLVLVACGGAPVPEGGSGGGRAIVALDAEPSSLNPLTLRSSQGSQILGLLHQGLLVLQPDMSWRGGLARDFVWDEEHLTLEIQLREDLQWQDGQALVAEDLLRSFQLYRQDAAGYPSRASLLGIQSLESDGPHHLRARFETASPDHLFRLVANPLPASFLDTSSIATKASWTVQRNPAGVGPFALEEWKAGQSMKLVAHPHSAITPRLEELEIRFVTDASQRLLQLELGEVDFAVDLPRSALARLEADPEIELRRISGRTLNYLQYNFRHPALARLEVRRAIAHAIDRQAMVDGILHGCAQPAASPLPPVLWAHHAGLKPLAHDPQLARELLGENGELELRLITRAGDPIREAVAERIRSDLSGIGITVKVEALELGASIERLQAGDFDLAIGQFGSALSVDPSPLFASDGPWNFGAFADAATDSLLRGGREAGTRAMARPWWDAFQVRFHELQPWTMLYYPQTITAWQTRLQGADPNFITPLWGAADWEIGGED